MDRCSDLAGHLAAVQVRCSAAESREAGAGEFALLLAEVSSLAGCVAAARHDLAALGAADIVGYHVPAATDELEAVIAHTSAATCTILDQCERLGEMAAGTTVHGAVDLALARIYEACSFQDITGQRVTKVVRTLQLVEERLHAIVQVFAPGAAPNTAPDRLAGPEPLLSGPQFPGSAMDQSAVDALLETAR